MSESDWLMGSVNKIMAFQIASGLRTLFQVLFTAFQTYLSVWDEIITGLKSILKDLLLGQN